MGKEESCMADTILVDIYSMNTVPKNIPVINVEHPALNYPLTEYQLRQLIQMPNYNIYEAGTHNIINGDTIDEYFPHGGGGGGTSNYNELSNKPSINNVTLRDNLNLSQLGGIDMPSTGDVNQALVVTETSAEGKPTKVGFETIDPWVGVDTIEIEGAIIE